MAGKEYRRTEALAFVPYLQDIQPSLISADSPSRGIGTTASLAHWAQSVLAASLPPCSTALTTLEFHDLITLVNLEWTRDQNACLSAINSCCS